MALPLSHICNDSSHFCSLILCITHELSLHIWTDLEDRSCVSFPHCNRFYSQIKVFKQFPCLRLGNSVLCLCSLSLFSCAYVCTCLGMYICMLCACLGMYVYMLCAWVSEENLSSVFSTVRSGDQLQVIRLGGRCPPRLLGHLTGPKIGLPKCLICVRN